MISKKRLISYLLTIAFILLSACTTEIQEPAKYRGPTSHLIQDNSEITQPDKNKIGQAILSSYAGSYALLIGESRYSNWPSLDAIPNELQEVEKVLTSQGFHVEKTFNLEYEDFKAHFDKFINQYGFDVNNRLLFFYSGHGYTRKDKGYLVPIDAADPNINMKKFLQKAIGMEQVLTWARRIEAKHVLFLFDSCFSGTIFKARDLSTVPPQINIAAQEPVRQFITAGSANESVPAKSVFTPVFVDALRYGWGDLYQDGYITGQELGLYLKNKVSQHSLQTPQYGKIKDYKLSRGDFIFFVGKNPQNIEKATIPSNPAIQPTSPTMIIPPKPTRPDLAIIFPDSDGDGLKDNYDKCRYNTALEISAGIDEEGCPLDSDQDNFPNYQDICPNNSREQISKGVDYKGCPKDTDRDGVGDFQDKCPRTFPGSKVKENGCPVPFMDK